MSKTKEIINETAGLFSVPVPTLGIDIDGCIDECPYFFSLLTNYWTGKVFVISCRSDRAKAEEYLQEKNIRYDELFLVNSLDAKAKVIEREGVFIYFDDQPECLKNVDSMRNVMLVRNAGNFDFDDQRWMLSEDTGKIIK